MGGSLHLAASLRWSLTCPGVTLFCSAPVEGSSTGVTPVSSPARTELVLAAWGASASSLCEPAWFHIDDGLASLLAAFVSGTSPPGSGVLPGSQGFVEHFCSRFNSSAERFAVCLLAVLFFIVASKKTVEPRTFMGVGRT